MNIRKQLFGIYMVALMIPILVVGTFLVLHTRDLLKSHHEDLLAADNLRVETILDEITTQVSQLSLDIISDRNIKNLLGYQYYINANFDIAISKVNLSSKIESNPAIESITIYTNNRHFFSRDGFIVLSSLPDWFVKASAREDIMWAVVNNHISLLVQIPINNNHDKAVLVLELDDSYLKNRIDKSQYDIRLKINDDVSFYEDENIKEYENNSKLMVSQGELELNRSRDFVEIYVYSKDSIQQINQILSLCLFIVILALIVPSIISRFFTNYFAKRILMLQTAMHKASCGDYEIKDEISGRDEISQAFDDLQAMIYTIKKKEADIYEAKLREVSLEKEQHAMEFKMLTSQINPHFLYNTLETIRMKAITVGAREVADAIKMLGKSMRYVFENVGINYTSLQKEINHVNTYLNIQKMRFETKFTSTIIVEPGIDTDTIKVMPLLIQPVVENAILHGLEEKEKDGEVVISISKNESGKLLLISVRDNGDGMDEETLNNLRNRIETKDTTISKSIGLYNINQRLKIAYGDLGRLLIDSVENGGTTICIEFPLEKI